MELVQNHLDHYYKECNYNCAETVFCAACEAWGMERTPETLRLMAGFGGGCGCGSICGAVSGAVAALSYRYVEEGGGHQSPYLMAKVRLLMRLVRQRHGDEFCKTLKPMFHTKEEHCLPTITVIAKILDEVEQTEIVLPQKNQ